MKYKLPILTCLVFLLLVLFGGKNGYLNDPIFSSLNAQSSSNSEKISLVKIENPIDASEDSAAATAERPVASAVADDELLTDPDVILQRAIARMNSEFRFQASLRHKINMFNQQFVGTGHYRQFGNGTIKRLRFELKTQVGDKTSSVIQVCDGRHLWTRENLTEETTLSRIDVRYVRDALAEYERNGGAGNGVGRLATDWGANIAMGGFPRLLASIDACFNFTSAQKAVYEDVPVWVLVGTWKNDIRQRLIEEFNDGPKFPAHLPDAVKLVLSRDKEFKSIPREIQYLRLLSDKTAQPMVSLQLYDMTRLVDMNAAQFDYQRGEQVIVDRTQAFLDKYISE